MISRRVSQIKIWNLNRFNIGAFQIGSHSVRSATESKKYSIVGLHFQSWYSAFRISPFSSLYSSVDSKCSSSALKCFFSTHIHVPSIGIVDVPLAQTGEGIAECELLKWFVKEGDQVEEFQPLCEVQSDKATIEITSRYKGKISEVHYFPGDIVKVGESLLKIKVDEIHSPHANSDCSDSEDEVDSELAETSPQSSSLVKETIGVLCTPSVRHLIKKYGIPVTDVLGTGKDGRILKQDVLKYALSKGLLKESTTLSCDESTKPALESAQLPNTSATDQLYYEEKTVPLRGFQRSMVKSMTLAAGIPHFHYVEEICCDALLKLKASFRNASTNQDVKHTYLPFLIKSLSMALMKHPILNSSFKEEANEVILKGSHNIGVAMATLHGLVVPNIKKVQSLSILEITEELSRLQKLALSNSLPSEDITGGTITLSNIGSIGGKFGSPLLNLPEVAIIAIGRIRKLPQFVEDGSIRPVSIANVVIGADHRIVDGATVARFCNEWKNLIENPELLLLHMR